MTLFDFEQLWLQSLVVAVALCLIAVSANWLTKHVIARLIGRALALTPLGQEERQLAVIIRRLSNIVPAIIVQVGIGAVPHIPPDAVTVTRNIAAAFMVLTTAVAIGGMLRLLNNLYQRRPGAESRPIKGYVQVGTIIVYFVSAILIIAALMNRSPWLLFSGLGAMAAILMLVFKDTILSLVASVQLTSNDMVRLGDWIEMPQVNADGDVIDIALHTVKVQNWDKTITTIPTHRLISESFKNWRGMQEAGGRRIMRSLMIDQTSVRFLAEDEILDLGRFALLEDYLAAKSAELAQWNAARPERSRSDVNARRLTNIGTFRAYVLAYLTNRADISKEMTLIVRQMAPSEAGLPLEIYCFTTTTAWATYESIQADIFDHLMAILPEFHLRLFQQPTGSDLRQLVEAEPSASE